MRSSILSRRLVDPEAELALAIAGIAPIQIGDEATVKVEGVGTLMNTILAK